MAIIAPDTLNAACDSRELQYRVYSDLTEIARLSSKWDALLAESSCNKAFGSLQWYVESCRIQSSLSPLLVTAAVRDELICILPLALSPGNGTVIFPHFANDYNDILVRGGRIAPAADLLKYALSLPTGCQRIILSKLRPDSACASILHCLRNTPAIECRYRETEVYSYIRLPDTFDEYLMSRRKLFRRNVKYALRKVCARGLTMRELSPDEFDPALVPKTFIRLILDRQDDTCLFRHAHAQALVERVVPPLFSTGSIRVFGIFNHQQMVAIDLYFVNPHGVIAWNGGFLAEIARLSPGTALIAFAIERAIAARMQEFDFGDGDEEYKRHWTNSQYSISTMELVQKPRG